MHAVIIVTLSQNSIMIYRQLLLTLGFLMCASLHCLAIESDSCHADVQCFENVQCILETDDEFDYSGYMCECPCSHGFNCTYYDDISVCEDIDECELAITIGVNICLPNAQVCVNTYGAYYCQCLPGYEGFCELNGVSNLSKCPECIDNAYCDSNTNFTCQCVYEDQGQCIECPRGTYVTEESPCVPCPLNSDTEEAGLLVCTCDFGYYRLSEETQHDDCTRSPSAPLDLTISNLTNTSVVISWLPSLHDGGRNRSEIYYDITYLGLGAPNGKFNTTNTEIYLTELQPDIRYRVQIKAENMLGAIDVTSVRDDNISFTTLEGVGGIVTFPEIIVNNASIFINQISWSPPSPSNGRILYYNARITSIEQGVVFTVVEIQEEILDLLPIVLINGDYLVEIQAVTMIGGGNYSIPIKVIVFDHEATPPTTDDPTNTTDTSNQSTAIDKSLFGYSVIPSVLIVVVAVGVFSLLYYRRYRNRKTKKRMFRESLDRHHSTSALVLAEEVTGGVCPRFKKQEIIHQQLQKRPSGNKYILESMSGTSQSCPLQQQLEDLSQHIPQEVLLSQENIQLSNVIGEGEFGQVYKGCMKTKFKTDVVAVKTLKALSSVSDVKLLMKEIVKMVNFDHPNVMTLTGVILVEGGAPLLVMPYMVKGTLLAYVRDNKSQLFLEKEENKEKVDTVSKTLTEFARQVALGMEYLSKNRVVHRDLAARNCLLDITGTVKVADFGLSEDMYSTNYFRQKRCKEGNSEMKVPIRWMPLESIEEGLYTEKSDVWSYGVTVWEIFTCGKVPYHGISCMALPGLLRCGENLEKPHNTACSQNIYSLLLDCWNSVPQSRPKFTEIVKIIDGLMEEKFGYMRMESSLSLQ